MTSAALDGEANGSGIKKHIGPLLLLTTIFFFNFSARMAFAPLIPEIQADLHFSHATAGSLFFLISCGYFVSLICSGWFAAKLNHRGTIILSSFVLGLALICTAFVSNLWSIRIILFLLGASAGLYLPSGIATITAMIPPGKWGKAVAIHELAPNIGLITTPLISELIMVWYPWQAVPVVMGITACLLGITFACRSGLGTFAGVAPDIGAVKAILTEPPFWIIVVLFGLGISAAMGIYTMLPLYLVTEQGIERNTANTLVALSRLSGPFLAFFGGWASDRYGPRKTMLVVFLFAGLATVGMGVLHNGYFLVLLFFQPMVAVCFFPAGFAALSRIGTTKNRNIAVSLVIPGAYIFGGGIVPVIIGVLGDVSSFAVGIAALGGLITLGVIPAYYLKFKDF